MVAALVALAALVVLVPAAAPVPVAIAVRSRTSAVRSRHHPPRAAGVGSALPGTTFADATAPLSRSATVSTSCARRRPVRRQSTQSPVTRPTPPQS
ncbi:hypothetical protein Vqi01_12530 [Micromonospora qiuiae]|uniref:Secreted protein n=1 Tax=Micromonospora qiuiae TaxID=502268 RepID=A0ABQ4J7U9_9ACTN|nr:hypothetical protein Vqi01_12530 [Micromonospora qiuiae]